MYYILKKYYHQIINSFSIDLFLYSQIYIMIIFNLFILIISAILIISIISIISIIEDRNILSYTEIIYITRLNCNNILNYFIFYNKILLYTFIHHNLKYEIY